MNVMVDIEGIGKNDNRGAILAIGACTFDSKGIACKMYTAVDLLDSVFNGFTIDPGTVDWWRKQSDEAKSHVKKGVPIREALNRFGNFVNKNDIIWAKGPDYDLVMITTAYEMLGMRCPFQFRNARCVRTRLALGRALGLSDVERTGVKHFALADAIYQAEQIIKITNYIQQLTTDAHVEGMEYTNLW